MSANADRIGMVTFYTVTPMVFKIGCPRFTLRIAMTLGVSVNKSRNHCRTSITLFALDSVAFASKLVNCSLGRCRMLTAVLNGYAFAVSARGKKLSAIGTSIIISVITIDRVDDIAVHIDKHFYKRCFRGTLLIVMVGYIVCFVGDIVTFGADKLASAYYRTGCLFNHLLGVAMPCCLCNCVLDIITY